MRNMASEWSESEFGLSIEASPAARAIVALPLQPPPGSQPNGFPTASGSSSMSLSSTLIRQRPSPARLVASTSSAICPGASGRRSFHPTCQRKAPKLDPYGVLDLPRKATKKEIKERFYEVRPTLHSISRGRGFGDLSSFPSGRTPPLTARRLPPIPLPALENVPPRSATERRRGQGKVPRDLLGVRHAWQPVKTVRFAVGKGGTISSPSPVFLLGRPSVSLL